MKFKVRVNCTSHTCLTTRPTARQLPAAVYKGYRQEFHRTCRKCAARWYILVDENGKIENVRRCDATGKWL